MPPLCNPYIVTIAMNGSVTVSTSISNPWLTYAWKSVSDKKRKVLDRTQAGMANF